MPESIRLHGPDEVLISSAGCAGTSELRLADELKTDSTQRHKDTKDAPRAHEALLIHYEPEAGA
jgi:hypothetical protein